MNNQKAEKTHYSNNDTLSVRSVFKSIQGEGPFVGEPCVFVRLAGCNLRCPGCDTDYTSGRRTVDVYELYKEVKALAGELRLVVLTGGEPMRQDIAPLVYDLIDGGFRVQVETNGTIVAPGLPWGDAEFSVVCSPKTSEVDRTVISLAKAVKYVVRAGDLSEEDGLPLFGFGARLPCGQPPKVQKRIALPPPKMPNRYIYLQPEDAKDPTLNQANLKAAMDSCLRFGYRLSLQIHKIIGVE